MPDDRQVYSDEQFALILRKAAELASKGEPSAPPSGGLTLAEMKSAAAQAGLDPALIERAARMLAPTATGSLLERLTGGPVRHKVEARFPVKLDENGADRLLSTVRIAAGVPGHRDVGHSSAMGMTWHDGGDLESLGVTARPNEDGTTVSVALDRRGTLSALATGSGIAMFMVFLFAGSALYPESPAQGIGGLIVGVSGILAIARGYWASSTRKERERISVVMDAVEQNLRQPETGRPTDQSLHK